MTISLAPVSLLSRITGWKVVGVMLKSGGSTKSIGEAGPCEQLRRYAVCQTGEGNDHTSRQATTVAAAPSHEDLRGHLYAERSLRGDFGTSRRFLFLVDQRPKLPLRVNKILA